MSHPSDVFLSRDDEESDPEACAAYENQALEKEEEMPHTDEAKTTNL